MSVADQEHAAPRFAPSLDALLHPVPLAALALLLVNDHVLKASHPGWLSGKLSDVAGLILLPFMLLAAWDLVRLVRPGPPAAGPRLAVGSVIAVVIAFTVIEVVPLGSDLYRVGLGSAQWPFRVFGALIASQPLPGLAPVQLTSDLSDLLALPAAITVLAVRPWRRRVEKGRAWRSDKRREAEHRDRTVKTIVADRGSRGLAKMAAKRQINLTSRSGEKHDRLHADRPALRVETPSRGLADVDGSRAATR